MFGWIQDHLVLGVIDEIDLRPLYIALRPQPTSTGSSFVDAKQTKLQVVGKRDSAKAGGSSPPYRVVHPTSATSSTITRLLDASAS